MASSGSSDNTDRPTDSATNTQRGSDQPTAEPKQLESLTGTPIADTNIEGILSSIRRMLAEHRKPAPSQSASSTGAPDSPDAPSPCDTVPQPAEPATPLPAPRVPHLRQSRKGQLNQRLVRGLIQMQRNVSNVELSLIAITVAVMVLKVTLGELANQVQALSSGGSAEVVFDVSVLVGFIAIAIAAVQIPRSFTETLIYSNQDAIRVLALLGATPRFVARSFRRIVLRAVVKSASTGIVIAAVAYIAISEILQLWVPLTRTAFVRDFAEALFAIVIFMAVVNIMVAVKVHRLLNDYRY